MTTLAGAESGHLLPLSGKQDRDKKDKDKKHKKGVEKHKKHKKDKKKKNKLVEEDVTDTNGDRRLKKQLQEAERQREQLQREKFEKEREIMELEKALKASKIEEKAHKIITIDEEESTTATSTTTTKTTKTTTKNSRTPQLAKTTLWNRARKIATGLVSFYHAEATTYVSYEIEGAEALLLRVITQHEAINDIVDRLRVLNAVQPDEEDQYNESMDTIEKGVKELEARFVALKFGDLKRRRMEWEQEQKVKEQSKSENKDAIQITRRMEALVAERQDITVLIQHHEAVKRRDMDVEGPTPTAASAKRRVDIYGTLEDLLNIARDTDKTRSVLKLYNTALEIEERAGDLARQWIEEYGAAFETMPSSLAEKKVALEQLINLVRQKWAERESMFQRNLTLPKKQLRDNISDALLLNLGKIETLLVEVAQEAMVIHVMDQITEVPAYVSKNPLKLFVTTSPHAPPLMRTLTQQRVVLHEGAIDITHIKNTCLSINNGLFLAPSQFAYPPGVGTRNGVYTAQDISKHQIITFCDGQVLRDDQVPQNTKFLPLQLLLQGSQGIGLLKQYLLMDRYANGQPLSADDETIVSVNGEDRVVGAGGFIHDCINLEKYQKYFAALVVPEADTLAEANEKDVMLPEQFDDIDANEARSVDEDSEDSGDSDAEGFYPIVPDPEMQTTSVGATRPCVNAVMRFYDDAYNECVLAKAATKAPEFSVKMDLVSHRIVVIEALRTIRKGEEIFIKLDHRVWSNMLRGGHTPVPLPPLDPRKPLRKMEPLTWDQVIATSGFTRGAYELEKELAIVSYKQSAIQYPLVQQQPAYDENHLDIYEPPTRDDDEVEEEEEEEVVEEEEEEEVETNESSSEAEEMSADLLADTGSSSDDGSDSDSEAREYEEYKKSYQAKEKKAKATLEQRLVSLKEVRDQRRPDFAAITALMKKLAANKNKYSFEEYYKASLEIMVRTGLLLDDDMIVQFQMETVLCNMAYNTFQDQLDTGSAWYQLLQPLQEARKTMENLRIKAALEESKEYDAEIARQLKLMVTLRESARKAISAAREKKTL